MIPSVLSAQIKKGIEDFLRTTFPISTPFFHGIIDRLIEQDGGLFKGPYVSVKLPYKSSKTGPHFFQDIPLGFHPYEHQEKAFQRLSGQNSQSTIIATGTGSGKTECFLYPILDHCYRHRGEHGIKAIIIYPMNALATDQAKRIAKTIHNDGNLINNVSVGLFIGQEDEHSTMVMTPDKVITNKETIRLKPPDILLTNYKMLDFLLIRPKDYPVWKENEPESLKYLVVDELHTFDGAQGTDLACLIRRLKDRLQTPKNHLCCIGTSATLGAEGSSENICKYAEKVFDEQFNEGAVITESVLSPEDFLAGSQIVRDEVVSPEQSEKLVASNYASVTEYVKAQYELWYGEKAGEIDEAWRVALAERLRTHGYFWKLVSGLNNRVVSVHELITVFDRIVPEFSAADVEYKQNVIASMLALISMAQNKSGDKILPFLNVRVQLWLRELRRMIGEVKEMPSIKFYADLKEADLGSHLPIVHCRECGAMGWGGTMRQQDIQVNPDLQTFYAGFFRYSPTIVFLFPAESKTQTPEEQKEFANTVCGHCLHLDFGEDSKTCPSCGKDDRLVPIFLSNKRIQQGNTPHGTHNCPYCKGHNSLTIIGSRAASLISVVISQLYASPYNDDKKLLTFSDSVQDASHRAGFFAARTYRFNFRSALQQCINDQNKTISLVELPMLFRKYWAQRKEENDFITTFLPPNMEWMDGYEELVSSGTLPEWSTIKADLNKRIEWEIMSEFGFNCRIGRTLEKTNSSAAFPDRERLEAVYKQVIEPLRNEIGNMKDLDKETVSRFLAGFMMQLKTKGAIYQTVLDTYIDNWGGTYVITRIPYMPNFGQHSRTPGFLTRRSGKRFDTLLRTGGSGRTWHQDWVEKSFGHLFPGVSAFAEQVYGIIIPSLVSHGVLHERVVQGYPVWGLDPVTLSVSNKVTQFRCYKCGHNVSIAETEREQWVGNNCLRFNCNGKYGEESIREDYYGRLYATGDVKRIFAAEHTGLLEREKREKLEKQFIAGNLPGSPNLLSCTPTLEMGIDIGDLSSIILCSVPPSQVNYVQRIGRAGRRDGNSLNLTVANGRPHDLYFYAEPEEMISGKLDPPGCFLDAPAVLERQLAAYCLDRWVNTGLSITAVPGTLEQVLSNLEKKENKNIFPHNFLFFIESNKSVLLDRFLMIFKDWLSERSRQHLTAYINGSEEGKEGLHYRIISDLASIQKERDSLRKRVQRLSTLIREKEASPVRDQNYDDDLQDLKIEKASLNHIIRTINLKHTFNFLTDEGLLPNYAFPESGVILRSIIYRRTNKPGEDGKFRTETLEYERPAATAILELAPENRFYAEGRKVQIDQINMSLSEVEEWRFCNSCTYLENIATGKKTQACPQCGSTLWSDEGQKRRMIKMRQVIATTSDRKSRVEDDSDEREPEFFIKEMLAYLDESKREIAYKLKKDDYPFGMEFMSKATFREVNFGKVDSSAETINIAGKEIPKEGFKVCRECGRIHKRDDEEIQHAFGCRYRKTSADKNMLDFLYLYREFSSEAIRILLPLTSFAGAEKKLHSFIAALYLGLQKKFEGGIDHLRTTLYEEPIPDALYRKKYLILYDTVPGGTGYLKQIMQDEKQFMNILEKALDIMKNCSCQKDPEKDGCYRCIYAYRNSHERDLTSRDAAIEILSEIINRKESIVKTDSLKDIVLNPLFDSELESMFVESLRRTKWQDQTIMLKQEVVNNKPGWYLKINQKGYFIEPQVPLNEQKGVMVPSKADFVIYPERTSDSKQKPVVVFTDGYQFHKNRIGKDMAQRMAIVQSGKYRVWSISWDDVYNKIYQGAQSFVNFANINLPTLSLFLDQYDDVSDVKKLSKVHELNSFDIFIHYLALPQDNMWMTYAGCQTIANLGVHNLTTEEKANDVVGKLFADLPPDEVAIAAQAEATGAYLYGLHDSRLEDQTLVARLFVTINKTALQDMKIRQMKAVCKLFDDVGIIDQAVFKDTWNGFIRLYNIYQFLPLSRFISSKGVAAGEYGNLGFEFTDVSEETKPTTDALKALMEITDKAIHGILIKIAEAGLPLPEIGYELSNEQGEIIASGELCWPDKKIAVLRDAEMEFVKLFESADWKVLPLDEAVNEPNGVIELLK